MKANRHPGYVRRREQRLQDEADQRAFDRQQREHIQATAAPALPQPSDRADFIERLAAAGRGVLSRVAYH